MDGVVGLESGVVEVVWERVAGEAGVEGEVAVGGVLCCMGTRM